MADANIIVFSKPVTFGPIPTGMDHSFILLQDQSGAYTMIARGGPESASLGSPGLNSGDINSGFGTGNILANVELYSDQSRTPAFGDFYEPDILANMPKTVVFSGTDAEAQAIFSKFSQAADLMNYASIPYTVPMISATTSNSNSAVATYLNYVGIEALLSWRCKRLIPPRLMSHLDSSPILRCTVQAISSAIRADESLSWAEIKQPA